MKKTSRFLAILLCLAICLTFVPVFEVDARAAGSMTIHVAQTSGLKGNTVTIGLSVVDNPGFAYANFVIDYDKTKLRLDGYEDSGIKGWSYEPSTALLAWDDDHDYTDSGEIVKLNFTVLESAEDGLASVSIAMSASGGGVAFANFDEEIIDFTVETGGVEVVSVTPGDANEDGVVNGLDLVRLRKYLMGNSVKINLKACDVKADGTVNGLDLVRLRKILMGTAVADQPVVTPCAHKLEKIERVEPTCTEAGNIEYYHCTVCGNYYANSVATVKITLNEVVLPAAHNWITEAGKPATDTEAGWTDYIYCSCCGEVLQEKVEIPAKGYAINYNINNAYIENNYLDLQNPNPSYYSSNTGTNIRNINDPRLSECFVFDGWYDGAGSSATKITRINAGETGIIDLYAHWTELPQTITYLTNGTPLGSDMVPEKHQSYYTSKGLPQLYEPNIYNYEFIGWYDNNRREVTSIPVGTKGEIQLNIFWLSYRNMAKPKKQLGDPIIIEDIDNQTLYFAYEIGSIINVPLSKPIWTVDSVQGLSTQQSQSKSVSTSDTEAKSIASKVSQATVESGTWTLSSEWGQTTSVNEEKAEQNGYTDLVEVVNSQLKSGTHSITESSGRNDTTETKSGSETKTYNTTETDESHKIKAELSASIGANENSFTGKLLSNVVSAQLGGSLSTDDNESTKTHTGTDETAYNSTVSATNTTWNRADTQSETIQESKDEKVSKTLSNLISQKYNYGSSYAYGGAQSNNFGNESSMSKTNDYSNTVTYNKTTFEEEFTQQSTDGKTDGKYRMVLAGTAHVFGVVGFDIPTQSYFTYTYSVMDDEVYQFLDYTPRGSMFDDAEYSVLPFEVPFYVHKYVSSMMAATDGLTIVPDTATRTAKVTKYEGTDTDVLVPDFYSDGHVAYKITSIDSNAFAGDPIRAINLGRYVSEIPENAFADCTALEYISGNFTSIGNGAFAGCSALKDFILPDTTRYLGTKAFDRVPKVTVNLKEKEGAQTITEMAGNAAQSGAENVILDVSACNNITDISLDIPNINSFEIRGDARNRTTINNITIESAAQSTVLTKLVINNSEGGNINIHSPEIVLDTTSITGDDYALVIHNDILIKCIRDNVITTLNDIVIVAKNITLESVRNGAISGSLIVNGNIDCYDIQGTDVFSSSPNVETIDEELFNKLINGRIKVILDVNGGELEVDKLMGYCGDVAGELPEPVLENYEFVGWYDAVEDGELYTNESTWPEDVRELTLYARWEPLKFTMHLDANGGLLESGEVEIPRFTPIGTLPIPTRDYYTFVGWYDAIEGGNEVTAESVYETADPVTVYAHWTLNEVSDWVVADTLPEDAEVIEEKWTYDQKLTATSNQPTMEGYTMVNSTSEWSDYGAWSNWQDSAVYTDDSTQVETRTAYFYEYYTCSNCGQHWHGWGIRCYQWGGDAQGCGASNTVSEGNYHCLWSSVPYSGREFNGTGRYYNTNTEEGLAFYYPSGEYHHDPKTQWRYSTRTLINTYYFECLAQRESSTEVTAEGDISNVVHMLRYRAK